MGRFPVPTSMGKFTAQRLSVSDHMISGKSDSFIVDLESINSRGEDGGGGGLDKDVNADSRIKRNLSGKGRDSLVASSSPKDVRAAGVTCSACEAEKEAPCFTPMVKISSSSSSMSMGPSEVEHMNGHHSHQITIKSTGHNITTEGRWERRYNNSFRRSPSNYIIYWFSHPRRVLLFFATLSSLGTILLIFFTLSMSKSDDDEGDSWQR